MRARVGRKLPSLHAFAGSEARVHVRATLRVIVGPHHRVSQTERSHHRDGVYCCPLARWRPARAAVAAAVAVRRAGRVAGAGAVVVGEQAEQARDGAKVAPLSAGAWRRYAAKAVAGDRESE